MFNQTFDKISSQNFFFKKIINFYKKNLFVVFLLMLKHKTIENLLSFYTIQAFQDVEDEIENSLSEEEKDEDNSSEAEENEMVILRLTLLLRIQYLK